MNAAEKFAADVDDLLARWDAVNRHSLEQARELSKQITELADSMQRTMDNLRDIRSAVSSPEAERS